MLVPSHPWLLLLTKATTTNSLSLVARLTIMASKKSVVNTAKHHNDSYHIMPVDSNHLYHTLNYQELLSYAYDYAYSIKLPYNVWWISMPHMLRLPCVQRPRRSAPCAQLPADVEALALGVRIRDEAQHQSPGGATRPWWWEVGAGFGGSSVRSTEGDS